MSKWQGILMIDLVLLLCGGVVMLIVPWLQKLQFGFHQAMGEPIPPVTPERTRKGRIAAGITVLVLILFFTLLMAFSAPASNY